MESFNAGLVGYLAGDEKVDLAAIGSVIGWGACCCVSGSISGVGVVGSNIIAHVVDGVVAVWLDDDVLGVSEEGFHPGFVIGASGVLGGVLGTS